MTVRTVYICVSIWEGHILLTRMVTQKRNREIWVRGYGRARGEGTKSGRGRFLWSWWGWEEQFAELSLFWDSLYSTDCLFLPHPHWGIFPLYPLALSLLLSLSLSFTSCLARHKFSRVLPYDILPFSFLYPIAQSNDKPVYRPLNRQDSQDLLWGAEGN